jgi:hypothetical protein
MRYQQSNPVNSPGEEIKGEKSHSEEREKLHLDFNTMLVTLRILRGFIEKQVTHLKEEQQTCFNKGVADKIRLFNKIDQDLLEIRNIFLAPDTSNLISSIDTAAFYQERLKEAIISCAIIAHHKRYSKCNAVANFFRFKENQIEATSWKAWKELRGELGKEGVDVNRKIFKAYETSLTSEGRKISYNDYRELQKERAADGVKALLSGPA